MKNTIKNIISCLFLLAIFTVPLLLFLKPTGGLLIDERREAATFPLKIENARSESVKGYFADIDKFVSDNFPARANLIGANRDIALVFNDNIDPQKAFKGQENWLYLGNNFENTIDKFTGNKRFDERASAKRIKKLEAYANVFAKHGIKTIFLVGPDKQSIYPEYLPSIFKPAPERYITPILAQMQKDGVNVYDPTQDLIDHKDEGVLYSRTDTHWNLKAGELVVLKLLQKWNLNPPPAYEIELTKSLTGDIVSIANLITIPLIDDDNYSVRYKSLSPSAKLIKEDGSEVAFPFGAIATTDNNILINQDASNQTNLWIVGDSFTGSLVPFLSSAISHIEMMHIQKNSPDEIAKRLEIAKEKPRFALIVLVERAF